MDPVSLIIPPGFAQAEFRWSLLNDPEEMVFTLGVSMAAFTGPVDAAEDLATLCDTAFPAGQRAPQYTFVGTTVRVGQDGGPPVIAEASRNVVGTAGTQPLPNNCAALVRKVTGRGGRSGRGRMFIPPFSLPDDGVDARGMMNEGTFTQLGTQLGALFTGADWFLFHDELSPAPLTPDAIIQFAPQVQIATQRRRMRS